MNKMNVVRGNRCGSLRPSLHGRLLELKVMFALIFVAIHICHGPVGADFNEPVALPVFNLIAALVDKLILN